MIFLELQNIDAARQAHARMPQGKVYRHLWNAVESSEIEKSVIKRHAQAKLKQIMIRKARRLAPDYCEQQAEPVAEPDDASGNASY